MIELDKIKEQIVSELQKFWANKKVAYHSGIFFLSQLAVIIFGFLTKGIQTRALTSEGYGVYAFFTTLTGFSVLFFNLGLFPTMELMLASSNEKQREKELLGASFILTLIIGIAFSIFLFAISFVIDGVFHVQIASTLRLVIPLCIAFPFRLLIPSLAIGSNQIEKAAIYDVLFQLLFSVALAALFFYSTLTLEEIIVLNLSLSAVATGVIIFLFKPSAANFALRFKEIRKKNSEFGIHYYLGSMFSDTTYKLDELFITFFINTTQLGFYSLANIICSPMVIFSNAVAAALFKDFAQKETISKKLFAFNILWIVVSFTVLYFLSGFIIRILFGNSFDNVQDYVIPLSVSYIFKTLCQPYSFLAAKGKGKEIRNVAVLEGVASIITNIIFIPFWGVMGAIYSSIIARVIDYIGLNYYYRKYLKELKQKNVAS